MVLCDPPNGYDYYELGSGTGYLVYRLYGYSCTVSYTNTRKC
jgi:hypothetical protein